MCEAQAAFSSSPGRRAQLPAWLPLNKHIYCGRHRGPRLTAGARGPPSHPPGPGEGTPALAVSPTGSPALQAPAPSCPRRGGSSPPPPPQWLLALPLGARDHPQAASQLLSRKHVGGGASAAATPEPALTPLASGSSSVRWEASAAHPAQQSDWGAPSLPLLAPVPWAVLFWATFPQILQEASGGSGLLGPPQHVLNCGVGPTPDSQLSTGPPAADPRPLLSLSPHLSAPLHPPASEQTQALRTGPGTVGDPQFSGHVLTGAEVRAGCEDSSWPAVPRGRRAGRPWGASSEGPGAREATQEGAGMAVADMWRLG